MTRILISRERTMPIEYGLLKDVTPPYCQCPNCGVFPFQPYMRGLVQRSKRFLWVLWRRPYCAVICEHCQTVVGYESPPTEKGKTHL